MVQDHQIGSFLFCLIQEEDIGGLNENDDENSEE
jgi:hypothetical protein